MKELIRFQIERGLDQNQYDAINEHTNIIEELLESIGANVPKENRERLTGAIREFIRELEDKGITEYNNSIIENEYIVETEDKVDAYCDVIVFAVGAILKLGYDPIKAIEETGKEINSRSGVIVDGKFEKDLSDEAKARWYKADYSKA